MYIIAVVIENQLLVSVLERDYENGHIFKSSLSLINYLSTTYPFSIFVK